MEPNRLSLPFPLLNGRPLARYIGDGGIFRLGLPPGFSGRLSWQNIGEKLNIAFVGRRDQIHFKLYAAVDQLGSYHATDLKALAPADEELLSAIEWSRSHDPSPGFLVSIHFFLKGFGYDHLLDRI